MILGSIAVLWFFIVPPALEGLVEPSELARRADLVGREVTVDDRVRYFLQSKPRQGYDELMLRRTEVLFRLPSRLKQARSPSEPNARVRGTLKVVDGRLVCDVESLEMLPGDGDRLERELGRLRPDDLEGRRAWALWSERRGKELNEPKLEARGVELEVETLRLEADRPGSDPLALAEQSRGRPIPGLARDALFHRGFRAALGSASRADDLDNLAKRIEAALPDSARPDSAGSIDGTILEAYRVNPAAAYREAPETTRKALDRNLLADAIQKSFEKQLEARPGEAMDLADRALARLPDRPGVAGHLRQSGLGEVESRVASLRQSEVEELARTFRDQDQEARGRRLLRTWLDDRRKARLSGSDAEGRVLLAANYDKMLGDRATAADLLREALAIEPDSRPAVDGFLRMGYRKGDHGWFDPKAGPDAANQPAATGVDAPANGDSLRGLTRSQVRSRLGSRPDQRIRNFSQGRCLEQWIYKSGKGVQIINFLIEPGTNEPRVTSHYLDQL